MSRVFNRFSLRQKLVFSILLAGFVPLLVEGGLLYYNRVPGVSTPGGGAVFNASLWLQLLAAGVMTLVVTGVAAFVFGRSVSRKLTRLTEITSLLAVGEMEKEAEIAGGDEIGALAEAQAKLIEYLQGADRAANRISEGDFTINIHPLSERDRLANSFRKMVLDVGGLLGEIVRSTRLTGESAENLATITHQARQATEQIATTIQQVAHGTAQQTESITRTATSIDQMGRAIDGVAKGAQEQATAVGQASEVTSLISNMIQEVAAAGRAVTTDALEAAQASREGQATVQQTIRAMEKTREKMRLLSGNIQEMGVHSERIGSITETIEDMASQTNLLALNAAIETARAESQAITLTEVILNRQMVSQAHLVNQMLNRVKGRIEPGFWEDLARQANLDAITITNGEGEVVYANQARLIGWTFPKDPNSQTAAFYPLIHSKDGVVCQKAQVRSVDSSVYKYVGVSRLDEPGIVQVGFNADSLKRFELKMGGFAVVATEVRKLADRSSESAREIDNLIKSIQRTTEGAVRSMEESAREIEGGVEQGHRAGTALENILHGAEKVNGQAQQSFEAAEQMSGLVKKLVEAVETVSAVVEQNTAATEEMAANSAEVSQAIENIASVSEENSAAVEEVSASTEELSAQVEDVSNAAETLAALAKQLEKATSQFHI